VSVGEVNRTMTHTPNRLTEPPDSVQQSTPAELIADVLATIRLAGAIFLRAEYTEPWAYESPPPDALTRILHPEANRLILFHIVAEGRCEIRVQSGERLVAGEGEVVVLPYGEQHVMGSAEQVPPVPIGSLLPAPPWDQFPVIRYGGGGERTSVVCGYLHCDDPIFDPVVRALPPLFSVRPPTGPAANWVAASIQYALDVSNQRHPPRSSIVVRLPELLFREVLRLYVEDAPPHLSRWLAALHDPVVGRALVELHADPSRHWNVEDLAWRAACSRSTLNERFGRLLGRAPMQYLSEWRLHLASGLLRDTSCTVAEVANRVGYESEEAFNRAFKRAMGAPPAQWRRHVTRDRPLPNTRSEVSERERELRP
jgi:AraC-like DNA-binding protein